MSKAFLPEDTPAEEPELALPERPAGPQPITRAGRQRLAEERERLARSGESPRRLKILDRALATVVVVEPALYEGGAGFGCEIDVEDEEGVLRTYTLVGPDEIDPAAGRISAASPLGERLHGAHAGDVVELERRGGALELTVVGVRAPADGAPAPVASPRPRRR